MGPGMFPHLHYIPIHIMLVQSNSCLRTTTSLITLGLDRIRLPLPRYPFPLLISPASGAIHVSRSSIRCPIVT